MIMVSPEIRTSTPTGTDTSPSVPSLSRKDSARQTPSGRSRTPRRATCSLRSQMAAMASRMVAAP